MKSTVEKLSPTRVRINVEVPFTELQPEFDQAYKEWTKKVIGFVGYGTVGGARAIEHARSIAIEYGYANVRCSLLCPSSMDAPMLYDVAKDVGEGDADKGFEIINGLSPNGHIAPPEDVAAVGVWMLLDAPPHLSGVTLPVDGAENAG